MKSLAGSSSAQDNCPFQFNFNADSFKTGDTASYRIPESFGDMPFVGTLLEVVIDHVIISANDPTDPDHRMRGTRESHPVASARDALE